jgi:hypothetical protein
MQLFTCHYLHAIFPRAREIRQRTRMGKINKTGGKNQ